MTDSFLLTEKEESCLSKIIAQLRADSYILRVTAHNPSLEKLVDRFGEEKEHYLSNLKERQVRQAILSIKYGCDFRDPVPVRVFRNDYLEALAKADFTMLLHLGYTLAEAEQRGYRFKMHKDEKEMDFEIAYFSKLYDPIKDKENRAKEAHTAVVKTAPNHPNDIIVSAEQFIKMAGTDVNKIKSKKYEEVVTPFYPLASLKKDRQHVLVVGRGEYPKSIGALKKITTLYAIDRTSRISLREPTPKTKEEMRKYFSDRVHLISDDICFAMLFNERDDFIEELFRLKFNRVFSN